ncbi:uncharacterized protein N7446_000102 [Penicillium canescens]|uniref:Uncharacterized protein n=1 Tax=Penicillium canescens TaxID=5083 RepID=A0AAD6I5S9_PENCN|nr:uncharacterized protein N7446_000102 [Penicillium canescens]KAJ6030831.1 hypothetical protein N7460_011097 [Penicillium canescens]KAJ6059451.1 hypothetical protein N7444_003090 [Penicillium canescens]KAJ6077166.1 hypothetical protein N7446_000102 [Penicillium canescens]
MPFVEDMLRSVRCDVKGPPTRQSFVGQTKSKRTATAPQGRHGAITGVAFWRSGDRRLGRGHKSCLISECGYLARQIDPGPIIQSYKFSP